MRLLCRTALLVAQLLAAALAQGQTPAVDEGAGTGRLPRSTEREPRAAASRTADVVLVGSPYALYELGQFIGELLKQHAILPRFEFRRDLGDAESAETLAPVDGSNITVWIRFPSPHHVRLVFVRPGAMRPITREIPLLDGFDEFGRETIAQVVESTLEALFSQPLPTPEVQVAPPPVTSNVASNATSDVRAPKTANRAFDHAARNDSCCRVGIAYDASWSGPAFGLEHGPGLYAGVDLFQWRGIWTLGSAVAMHFAQNDEDEILALSIQNNRAWLLLGWRPSTSSTYQWFVDIGPGVNATRSHRSAKGTTAMTGEPFRVDWSPWVRTRFGVATNVAHLRTEWALLLDASLFRTHYDLEIQGQPVTVARPSVLCPGMSLMLAWQ